jgi:hypothetical protein
MSPFLSQGISLTLQPHIAAVAGLVPCAACGTMISVRASIVARAMVGTNHRDAGELALRAGHGREADALHAGNVFEHFLQFVHAGEESLRLGRERVARQEFRQHRIGVARLGVVLHGAGTQADRNCVSIEKLNCDRRVKWRTAWSSDTSGSSGGRARQNCAGIPSDAAAGAGAGGYWLAAPRPGLPSSNIMGSRNLSSVMLNPLQAAPRTSRAALMTSANALA